MDFEIRDELAELACIAFLLSGEENARAILERASSEDFVSYDGGLKLIVEASEALLLQDRTITYMSVRDQLERTQCPGALNALEKLGGDKGLYKITKTFQVTDGLISFREADDKVFAAPATELASLVKEKTNRRILNVKLQKLSADLGRGTPYGNVILELAEVISVSDNTRVELPERTGRDVYDRIIDQINRVSSNELIGIPSGFIQFDEETGGMKGNDFLVIGANDKHCKTQLGLSMINTPARLGFPSGIISMEMNRDLIINRLIAMNSGKTVPFSKLIGARDRMTTYERKIALEVWDSISNDPLYIIDELRSSQEIIPAMERMIRRYGVQGFLIDYLQKVEGAGTQEEVISNFSRQIANLCQRYGGRGVYAIVIVQHNDEGAKFQRVYGTGSTQFAYGSKQANKDATYKTTINVEAEQFECDCPDKQISREVLIGNLLKKVKIPRWITRPINNICPDCETAGRDPFIRLVNPQRRGRWTIEGARNARAGWFVPLLFDGPYMTLEEEGVAQRAPVPRSSPPEGDSFWDQENQ